MRSKQMYLMFLIFLALFSGSGNTYASFSAESEAYVSFPGDPEFEAGSVDAAATAVTAQMLFSRDSSGPASSRDLPKNFGPDNQGGFITSALYFSAQDKAYLKSALLIDPALDIDELLFPYHFFT